MIDSLKGILEKGVEEKVLIEVNGVGYGVYIAEKTRKALPEYGSEVLFKTYTYIRENQFDLYAFLHDLDRDLFVFLLKGNGVGPKLALSILSYFEAKDLVDIIRFSKIKHLTEVPGMGKKKAEKLILDLKDKCEDKFSSLLKYGVKSDLQKDLNEMDREIFWANDLKIALRNLGYRDSDIKMIFKEFELASNLPSNIKDAFKEAMNIFAAKGRSFLQKGANGNSI